MANQRGFKQRVLASLDFGDKAQTQARHLSLIKRNSLQELFSRFGMNFQAHHFKSVRASFITSSAGNVLAVPLSISPRRRSDSLSHALSEFGSPGASRSSMSFRRSSVRSFRFNSRISRSMSANARAIDYVLCVAALDSTAGPACTLTMRLSDVGWRRRQTKPVYVNHRSHSLAHRRCDPRSLASIVRPLRSAQQSETLDRLSVNSESHTKRRRNRRLERPARQHRGGDAPLPRGMPVLTLIQSMQQACRH